MSTHARPSVSSDGPHCSTAGLLVITSSACTQMSLRKQAHTRTVCLQRSQKVQGVRAQGGWGIEGAERADKSSPTSAAGARATRVMKSRPFRATRASRTVCRVLWMGQQICGLLWGYCGAGMIRAGWGVAVSLAGRASSRDIMFSSTSALASIVLQKEYDGLMICGLSRAACSASCGER